MAKKLPRVREAFVIDRSGSMAWACKQTISGFNEHLNVLQRRANEVEVFFTLVQFDDVYEVLYRDAPLRYIEPRNERNYVPRGATALYDAVGRTISALLAEDDGTPTVVTIQTDGEENASREYTRQMVFDMIKQCEAKGNWTFVFMGAEQNAYTQSQQLGIAAGNTVSYSLNDSQPLYRATADAIIARGLQSANGGGLATQCFYSDAGFDIDPEDLNKTSKTVRNIPIP